MHPLCDAIDEFVGEVQLYGFSKPKLVFQTWEDGMVLLIRAGLPIEAATEIEPGVLTVLINGVLVDFPTRERSKQGN